MTRLVEAPIDRSAAPPAIRVLHVAQPHAGGSLRVARDLALDQLSRGWAVDIACNPDSELAGLTRDLGLEPRIWRAARSSGLTSLRETIDLGKLIRQLEPDVVHLHSAKAGLAGRLAARGDVATVYQPHAWSFEAADGLQRAAAIAWERWATRWADAVVCVSEAELERGRQVGIRSASSYIAPNGVDLSRYPPASEGDRLAARRELGIGPGAMAVIIGRITKQKGQEDLLAAWPRVLARIDDAQLAVIGDGSDLERLRSLSVRHVRFTGARDDVATWLAACDVCVVSSRWDAGSLVTLEAMARSRPVIATDVGGMRAAIRDDAGAVVPVGACDELAAAIVRRLEDPDLACREGAVGRQRVESEFDLSRSTERIARIYGSVLDRRAGRA